MGSPSPLSEPMPFTSSFDVPTPQSRVNMPSTDQNPDFAPGFYHVILFSNFVVAQAQYIFNSKYNNNPGVVKPLIPTSLSYNEVVDARYIAEVAANAMSNSSMFILLTRYVPLITPVAVPWTAEEYMKHIGPHNSGKNADIERDLRTRFPPGPSLSTPLGLERTFDSPLTIVDQAGRILFWYLPDIISENAQVLAMKYCLIPHLIYPF